MKILIASVVTTLVCAGSAHAQPGGAERLLIQVYASTLSSPGGEEQRVAGGAFADEPEKTAPHGFSLRSDCGWGVAREVESDADLGWAVEITPVRVVDDAVTFRLTWARTRDEGQASTRLRRDMELTLRPGESIPLDSVSRRCAKQPATIGASLRATVARYPGPDNDRRLVGVDMWLVERLNDGTERSQPLSLRGLYHQPIPFYFDSITEGAVALDIFGDVTAAPGNRMSDVTIATRSRILDPNQPAGSQSPRQVTARLRITPDEVVSVQLPQLANSSAFASRALSLRIRVRQIR